MMESFFLVSKKLKNASEVVPFHGMKMNTLWQTNILLWKITMLSMGESTIFMAIFNSYFDKLPEGISH